MIFFNNVGETTHVHFHTHVVCLTIKWERMTLWSCIVPLHIMYYTVHFIYTKQVPQKWPPYWTNNDTVRMKWMIKSHS